PGGTRQRRVDRLHFTQHHALSNSLRNPDTLRRRHLGNGHGRVTDNSADHAIHLTTRNTAGNAADHTHGWRWGFLFLNDFDLLWNLGGGTQLPVDDISLDLFHYVNCRRRRGRRRWRRRRNQGHHQLRVWQCLSEDQGNQDHDSNDDGLQNKGEGGRSSTCGS